MALGSANVGAIVAQLRLDASDWERKIDEAMGAEDELAANSPTIKIRTDSAAALANIEAIIRAQNRLKDSEEKVTLNRKKADAAIAKFGEDSLRAESAMARLRSATRGNELAAAAYARTLKDVVAGLEDVAKAEGGGSGGSGGSGLLGRLFSGKVRIPFTSVMMPKGALAGIGAKINLDVISALSDHRPRGGAGGRRRVPRAGRPERRSRVPSLTLTLTVFAVRFGSVRFGKP